METLPSTPAQLLSLMASTSTQIDVFSDGIIQSVQAGEVNPLNVLIQLRAMEKASERILKEIRDNLLNEAAKYPGTTFEFAGNKVEKAELGTKYDYSKCNDTVWYALKAKETQIKSDLTERENFLKAVKAPFSLLDEGTGEVVTIHPPTKKSTTGLKVTIS